MKRREGVREVSDEGRNGEKRGEGEWMIEWKRIGKRRGEEEK